MVTRRTRVAPVAEAPATVVRKTRSRPAAPSPALIEALEIIDSITPEPVERRSRTRRVTPPVVVEPEAPSTYTPVDYDKIIKSHTAKATTPKKAIRAMCVGCMGGMIAEVRRCTSIGCPLYPFRLGENPFHKLSKHNKDNESEEGDDE